MFRRFVEPSNSVSESRAQRADRLFRAHPTELAAMLEAAWMCRPWNSSHEAGHPGRRSDLPQLPPYLLTLFLEAFKTSDANLLVPPDRAALKGKIIWEHLIYAYLIENTRVVEIFRRVLFEFRHGERLGTPSDGCIHWLRNTEELFFRDPLPYSIFSVVSDVRPDLGASRRNAYHRMFGIDLNHGRYGIDPSGRTDTSTPYPYVQTDAANREFVPTLEEFLREIWVGIENANNTSGSNPKDDAAIANLARRLHDMLQTRRQYGNLSQEEFFFVSMMSWFHLSLEYNSPIVKALKAEATSEDERLKKIGQKVGLPAYDNAFHLFRLADPLSALLIQIESGTYLDESAIPALYTPGPVATDIASIITNWSFSTGRSLKKRPVAVTDIRSR